MVKRMIAIKVHLVYSSFRVGCPMQWSLTHVNGEGRQHGLAEYMFNLGTWGQLYMIRVWEWRAKAWENGTNQRSRKGAEEGRTAANKVTNERAYSSREQLSHWQSSQQDTSQTVRPQ